MNLYGQAAQALDKKAIKNNEILIEKAEDITTPAAAKQNKLILRCHLRDDSIKIWVGSKDQLPMSWIPDEGWAYGGKTYTQYRDWDGKLQGGWSSPHCYYPILHKGDL